MKRLLNLVSVTVILAIIIGCSTQKRWMRIKESAQTDLISMARECDLPTIVNEKVVRDTVRVVAPDGRKVLLMNAVRDENGEMVATDVLDAAVVTARFRNLAERHGKVDVRFMVTIPSVMQDSKWQLRFRPEMYMLGDTVYLDSIMITGNEYRKAQLKGYEHYRKFLESIIHDSSLFLHSRALRVFLERNIPSESEFGVSEKEAIDHYTDKFRIWMNDYRISRQDKMYRKYVKSPIITEGIRLDTIIRTSSGEFQYEYVQTVHTRPGLSKVGIALSGTINEQDRKLYDIPVGKPLTFYISSISTLADFREKYKDIVLERKAEANTACYIDFGAGKADIDVNLGHNRTEIRRIERNLADLLDNQVYDLDSIVVTADSSPEGTVSFNRNLSRSRATAVSGYFNRFVKRYSDSLRRENGVVLSLGEKPTVDVGKSDIRFISRSNPENWRMLDILVERDSVLTPNQKEEYRRLRGISDADASEAAMTHTDWYRHTREKLYPRLRTVSFNFHLHRKGMIKDTVHTTVIDTAYMDGLKAIRDRDYKRAVELLRPYQDINTAVAYCAMDYDASAKAILEKLKPCDRSEYMLALIYSREGRTKDAIERYLNACSLNPSYVHRGNLDPEISILKKHYRLTDLNEK